MSHKRLKVNSTSELADAKTINNLPVELLNEIFSLYLKTEGKAKLCSILGQVSLLWKEVVLIPSLWRQTTFTAADFENGYSWLEDPDVLQALGWTKKLNLKWHRFRSFSLPRILLLILRHSPNLEEFTFTFSNNRRVPGVMVNLPTLCPRITRLQYEIRSYFPYSNMSNWIEAYSENLTKLSICHLFQGTGNPSLLLQDVANFCPNLTDLELDMVFCNEILELNILEVGCPKIKNLCLKNIFFIIQDEEIPPFQLENFCFRPFFVLPNNHNVHESIVHGLRGSKELRKLELINCDLHLQMAIQLPCTFLKKLKVQYNVLPFDGLYGVLKQWAHSLTDLDIVIGKYSLPFFFQYLKESGKLTLEFLSFQSANINVEELKQIIKQCEKLKYLCFVEILQYPEVHHVFSTREKINEWLSH